jgi:hypothetical protein
MFDLLCVRVCSCREGGGVTIAVPPSPPPPSCGPTLTARVDTNVPSAVVQLVRASWVM